MNDANLLNQTGLVLGFLGGLLLAVDLLGTERAKGVENAIRNILPTTMAWTKQMFRSLVTEPVKEVLPTILAVAAVSFCVLVFYLLSLAFEEGSLPYRIFYGLFLFMGVPLGIFAMLAIVIWIPLTLLIFTAPWIYCGAVWLIGSPLIAGAKLRARYDLKGAVPTAGILLVTLAFLLQLIATMIT